MKFASVMAAFFMLFLSAGASAQDITLSSTDKQTVLSGTLLSFDGEFYRIDTIFGEMTVDGSGVVCTGPACPSLQGYMAEISLSGAAEMGAVLLPALVEGFATRNGFGVVRETIDGNRVQYRLIDGERETPIAVFKIHNTTTDEGFADLIVNETDVVMALREIRPAEQKRARDVGLGDLNHPDLARVLALDALVPIVSPSNPVRRLSLRQLSQILAGEIDNWSRLGGVDAPIDVHLPAAKTGYGQAIERQIMRPQNKGFSSQITRHAHIADVKAAVENAPFALGVSSISTAGTTGQTLSLGDTCGFEVATQRSAIKTEDYPLSTPLFLYLPSRRLPKIARAFLDYTRSPSAQILIRRTGFIDQFPEEIPIDAQGRRFSNAIRAAGSEVSLSELQRLSSTLSPMSRLTISFRFDPGSERLDTQSRSYIHQLARALERGVYDGRKLVFMGFSDGKGPADANLKRSLMQAQAVRQAVIDTAKTANFSQIQLEVEGFGEALPMACDSSAWGRKINRRVEVWIR